jgi:hypothetical protein
VNDLAVFGSQALASLASGAVLYRFGWAAMNAVAAAILLLMFFFVAAIGARALPRKTAAADAGEPAATVRRLP